MKILKNLFTAFLIVLAFSFVVFVSNLILGYSFKEALNCGLQAAKMIIVIILIFITIITGLWLVISKTD